MFVKKVFNNLKIGIFNFQFLFFFGWVQAKRNASSKHGHMPLHALYCYATIPFCSNCDKKLIERIKNKVPESDYKQLIRERVLRDEDFIKATFSGQHQDRTVVWIKVVVRPVLVQGK